MLQSITLGNLVFDSPIFQGPLAGYSCAPFRRLIWEFSNPGFCVTEMISAKDLRHRKNRPARYLARDPLEKTLCYQISGNDVDDIAFATDIVSQCGADIIDLNCGCPKPKIRRKGCGTKLLATPQRLYEQVQAIKMNTDAVVSIKIRVAPPVYDHDDLAVIDAAQQAGVDFITVHGRHWTQGYDHACQIETIKSIKQSATVPVIANGDVENVDQLKTMVLLTGCDGVMISRATIGRPWLIGQIQAELTGEQYHTPSPEMIMKLYEQHLCGLIELDGEKSAMLQSRKLAKYYSRSLKLEPTSHQDG